jgi:hypothetical protein
VRGAVQTQTAYENRNATSMPGWLTLSATAREFGYNGIR